MIAATQFLNKQNSAISLDNLVSASQQVVNGMNYQLVFVSNSVTYTYVVYLAIGSNSFQVTSSTQTGTPAQNPTPLTPPPVTTPIVGGYQQISNPSQSQIVNSALNFLIKQFGNSLGSATLVSASQQVVNGINYKLIYSLSSTSPVTYIFVLYQAFGSNTFQLTSFTTNGGAASAFFGDLPLTNNDISSIPYFAFLQNQVIAAVGKSILTPGTSVVAVYRN